jgi:hypothetical protein
MPENVALKVTRRVAFTASSANVRERSGKELFVVGEDEAHNGGTAESGALALLCTDCSALASGAIDPLEWRRRTNVHLKNECAPTLLPSDEPLAITGY